MISLRKPLTRKLVTRPAAHGYKADLVITLYPNGAAELREARSRRPPVLLNLAHLYARARIAEALPSRKKPRRARRRP
jgi:hypothetical protein